MNKKKINAYFIIVILFFWHIIKKFAFKLKSNKNGIKRFKENYYPEFLIEISKESYEKLHKFESCINCSLCDSYCSNLTTFHRDGLPRISELALSTSSSLEEFRFSDNLIDVFTSCDNCIDTCVSICPNDYPIFDLIEVMKNYNTELDSKLNKLYEEYK